MCQCFIHNLCRQIFLTKVFDYYFKRLISVYKHKNVSLSTAKQITQRQTKTCIIPLHTFHYFVDISAFEVRECNPWFVLGVLCIIGCPVQLIREVFLRLHFRGRRHTFASLWGACLRFASFWRPNSCGDSCVLGVHLSKVCWGLIFCLRKAFIF